MAESRKENKAKNGVARCHTVYLKYSIFIIVSSLFLAGIWPEWLTHKVVSYNICQIIFN